MRILLLTQVVPYPPDSGPKIKTHNVLRYLAQHHEVHLLSFVRSGAEEANARELRGLCGTVSTVPLRRSRVRDLAYLARSLATSRPFLIERDDSRAMRQTVAGLQSLYDFDAVHADQLSMAQFAVDLSAPMRVLDEHNAVWTIVRRAAQHQRWSPHRALAELEWRKLRSYEAEVCRRFDLVTVVSPEDYAALSDHGGAPFPVKVVPIAVDAEELPYRAREEKARSVLSLATMFYPPNAGGVHWFGREVFPLIRREAPGTQFLVVGSRPPREVRQLASADSGVVVAGYVADLQPVLSQAAVLVVPLRSASGMRVRILEAFAQGIPVVSTTIGVEGIEARSGEHLLVADSPEEFARAVIRLLADRALALRLAEGARKLVEDRYDWRTALVPLDEVYRPGQQASSGGFGVRRQAAALPWATRPGHPKTER